MGTVEQTKATIAGTGDKTVLGRRSEYACMRQWIDDALEKPNTTASELLALNATMALMLKYLTWIAEPELEGLFAEMALHGDGVTRPTGDMRWRVYRVLGGSWLKKLDQQLSRRDHEQWFGDRSTAGTFETHSGAAARIRRLHHLTKRDGTPALPESEHFLAVQNVQVVRS